MAEDDWPAIVILSGLVLSAFVAACVASRGIVALVTALIVACALAATSA